MKRRTILKMAAGAALACAGGGGIMWFMDTPQFGRLPAGPELEPLLSSPHYGGGTFHNLRAAPSLKSPPFGGFGRFLFGEKKNTVPPLPLPSRKVDLRDGRTDRLIWLGHSSFLLQLNGRNYLIDPIFSTHASPVSFMAKAFPGATPYSLADIPDIDWLLLTHDHWDHLDYPTLLELKPRIKNVACPLGVDSHLWRWGFSDASVHPLDWNCNLPLGEGHILHFVTSHHFSGRTFTRNKTLWGGYVLQTPSLRLYFSGDGGYGPHFMEIGQKFGPLDIAFLDCGQYDKYWPHVHMTPEQSAQAAADAGARAFFPAHIGKFALALHAWDDPFKRVALAAKNHNFKLLTPMIGESLNLAPPWPDFPAWWETGSLHPKA